MEKLLGYAFQMSFAKLNISSSRTLSDIFARFGCIISPLCEITLSAGAVLAGKPELDMGPFC